MGYPFVKMSIFRLFKVVCMSFFVLEYRKSHFPGLKRVVGKMAIFGPKPWVNHMEKVSIFRLFEPLIFIA